MKIRYLKTIGLVAGISLVVILARPTPVSLIIGGIIVCLGEAIRVWAAGHLVRNQELTTSGPYAYLRDPLYIGRLFLLIGFCIMAWGYSLILLPLGLGIFALSYMPRKYRKEMIRLGRLFDDEYTKYAYYCRSLLPRIKPYPQARKRPWISTVFWKENREQYFILIVATVFLAMILRYLVI